MENVSEKNIKVILLLSRKSPAISWLYLGEKHGKNSSDTGRIKYI